MLPQKNNRTNNFIFLTVSNTSPHHTNQHTIMQQLQQALSCHSIHNNWPDDVTDEAEGHSSHKLIISTIAKEVQMLYDSLAQLLTKELNFSLKGILQQIFDTDNENYSCDVMALSIFYSLLKLKTVTSHNCYQLLKWIYDLTLMELSLELSNLKSSITKKLVALGFSILDSLRKSKEPSSSKACSTKVVRSQSCFKESVSQFIRQKEEQVSSMKFEVCRICEMPISIRFILSHSKLCEQRHQIKYNRKKLEQKGRHLLNLLNDLQRGSQEYQTLRNFFEKVFKTINEKIVSFALEGAEDQIEKILQEYQNLQNHENYEETLQLLQLYNKLSRNDDVCDTLSDKASKINKSRFHIRYAGSNTSFYGLSSQFSSESDFICEQATSEKTIMFKEEAEGANSYNSIKFGDFQVLKRIGRGSYSEVYLVRKRETKDLYAMKVIKIESLNQEKVQALKKEQRIYRSISGGYNVKLYYSFCEDNLYFLILDYGCGGSLRSLLEQEVYFEEKYVKTYLANLMLAVDSIHHMGIVHRDLKPDNLVINQRGQLILTDFNLSKLVNDIQSQKEGTFYGTADYIAPEILRLEPTDRTVDWFSVGVIAYQMVIGVTPFTEMTAEKVFQNIMKGEVQWPCEQQGMGVSSQCRQIIEALLHNDQSKRFGSTLHGANNQDTSLIKEMRRYKFFDDVDLSKTNHLDYFYIPSPPKQFQEDPTLTQQILANKSKGTALIQADYVVRYDILQSATKKYVKSHRNSRFKLQKELQVLKQLIPSSGNFSLKQHNSFDNFNFAGGLLKQNRPGVSCRALLQPQNQISG